MNDPRGVVIVIALLVARVPALGQNAPQQAPLAQSQRQAATGSVQDRNDAFVQKIITARQLPVIADF